MLILNRAGAFASAALLMLLSLGCDGGKPTGILVGQVTYKGKPVEKGEVQFQWKERGVAAAAALGSDGKFTVVDALPAGKYEVCVVPQVVHPVPGAALPPQGIPNVPLKAREFKTSGLTVEIKPGKNDVVLEVKD